MQCNSSTLSLGTVYLALTNDPKVSANEMGRVHFQPSIEFPLEFASRQQICVRLYSATTKDKQPAVTSIEDRVGHPTPDPDRPA